MNNRLTRLSRVFVVAITASLLLVNCGGGDEPTPRKKKPEDKGTTPVTPEMAKDLAKIKGKVVFKGEPTKPATISITGDSHCEKFHAAKSPIDEDLAILVNADGTLQNAVVYVESAELAKKEYDPGSPVVLDQHGCRYVPHTFGIAVGQKLEITNSDDTMHNVHFFSDVNEKFNNTQQKGELIEYTPAAKDVGRLKCDKHGWMKAWMIVLPHPFFGDTREKGTFEFAQGLPPGKYTFVLYHEVLSPKGEVKKDFEVKTGDNEIVFEVSK